MLHALGRTGTVDGLGLAEVGVESDARGRIKVDGRFMTTTTEEAASAASDDVATGRTY